jgi:hypothetical protein
MKFPRSILQVIVGISTVAPFALGCVSSPMPAPANNPEISSLDGLWLTNGYRKLIEVSGDTLTQYELTASSCIKAATAIRQPDEAADVAFFLGKDVNKDLGGVQEALRFTAGNTSDRRWMTPEGAIARVELIRTDRKPATCDQVLTDSPMVAYDIFWRTFGENYPFFALKKIDWKAVDAANRSKVKATTTPKELLTIFSAMIEPLQDAHTGIDAAPLMDGFGGFRPGPEEPVGEEQAAVIADIIVKQYVKQPLTPYCNGQIEFGMLPNNIAYLKIYSFAEYDASPTLAAQLRTLQQALDAVFQNSSTWKALIIDVRLNGGGSDLFGTEIAARLTNQPYLAYSKVIRNNPDDATSLTSPQPVTVTPVVRPGFLGKVTLLTGNESISAAETFAMALMGRAPAIVRIGEPTQGVFSDVMGRTLPNGWSFGLPNEIYLDAKGKNYDGAGVVPDIASPVFRLRDIAAKRDPALVKAIALSK